MVTDLQERSDQINSSDQNKIIIKEISIESEDQNQKKIKESKRLFNEGSALNNQNKYQEAIVCLDKAISINNQYDFAWNNKDNQLLNIIIQDMHYIIRINTKKQFYVMTKLYLLILNMIPIGLIRSNKGILQYN
ncbi:unnamed protein product [Paramecium sonneborni]|uniref:Tetratricopeptide repeat protein n=1 Tax=Paramecium sonneborni TaxID=65129 RepID=A0A8S1RSH4_9CILI|nr:unnamed protein product [Paramecium sonneborni]